MNCTFIKDNLFVLAEGTLPPDEQVAADQHLKACAGCRHLIISIRSIEDSIQATKTAEPDPFVSSRIIAHLESRYLHHSESRFYQSILILRPVMLGIFLGLAVLTGILFGWFGIKKHDQISQAKNDEVLRSELFIDALADEDMHIISNP